MAYFPNDDFSKSYPLPGISYYMSNMPASVPGGQPQQGVLAMTAAAYDGGQQFSDGSDFALIQHQQQYAQPTAAVPQRQQQYFAGQKQRRVSYQYQPQQQQQDPNAMATGDPMNKDGRKVDPFAPECSIPLPYQLGDEYRDKRLSKVETLRFAIRYIHHLEKLLADSRHDEQCDCDFTIRSSSVSDSCQSPAVTTTDQQPTSGGKGKNGKVRRKHGRRASSDETSDEN